MRFVPLVGREGWAPSDREEIARARQPRPVARAGGRTLAETVAACCEPFDAIESANLDRLLARIGDARIVLLGEASHGTSEFYRMRERITRELILKRGFRFVAIEGDWPDAARVDHYVRHMEYPPSEWTAFARFPVWMWRNDEVRAFVDWLRAHNAPLEARSRVAFHGLDLYSLYDFIRAVLKYLDRVDPATARVARERYGCLTPWQSDPATYGHAARRRLSNLRVGRRRRADRSPAQAPRICRTRWRALSGRGPERPSHRQCRALSSRHVLRLGASWNLRDSHMFETLKTLLSFDGANSKAIVGLRIRISAMLRRPNVRAGRA